MSAQPTVCAICLTKDRPEMLARALRSFQAQTYENKRLLIVNSGPGALVEETESIWEPCFIGIDALTIGALRNHACKYASHHYAESWKRPEIFIHWDDDDVSHPNRIAEQVALLQSSGADVVGYSNLLFWQVVPQNPWDNVTCDNCGKNTWRSNMRCLYCQADFVDKAWLYTARDSGFSPGTSLAYWRKTWGAKPFPDISQGEDNEWLRHLKLEREPSLSGMGDLVPRLVASIHAGNTSDSYRTLLAVNCEQRDHYFRRVPQYDAVCREAMAL